MKLLVTGTAGFIGYHFAKRMVAEGYQVVGLDSINDYYDVRVKYSRLETAGIQQSEIQYNQLTQSKQHENYRFIQLKLEDRVNLEQLFAKEQFDIVVNLAAQAGVRYSLTNPHAYIDSNIIGFTNILECCRHNQVKHLAYASSSSVYGLNESAPFSTSQTTDHPMSLYAASKKSNELMAHVYSHLYNLPTTGLRFFTVYGPWGRPDMALFLFAKAIINNEPIQVFNNGQMIRDFTYIDDIVEGVRRVALNPAAPNLSWSGKQPGSNTSSAPYKIYNIGNNNPVQLLHFIESIEKALGKTAQKIMMPLQAGDVPATSANVDDLVSDLDYKPNTTVEYGISQFIDWYRSYYKV
jgi:UDP-glucuronate 4-epimerase